MRRILEQHGIDGANALGARVFWVLFAMLALCATPLGGGELVSSESYIHERKKGEVRAGDLPLRFALPTPVMPGVAHAENVSNADIAAAVADASPDILNPASEAIAGESCSASVHLPSKGRCHGGRTFFEARAPPRV